MDLYEEITSIYLAVVDGLFVMPQCPILRSIDGERWEAYPDFIALSFRDRRIRVIEVTKRSAHETAGLADKLRKNHRPHVEHYVRTVTLNNALDFPFLWRFFVRNSKAADALKHADAYREYVAGGGDADVVTLDSVFAKIAKIMP
jgi:hypothetical protein